MDMNELLKEYNVELDEKKQELCCELQHPLLINGTTGSGKTFLLLARNAYLMNWVWRQNLTIHVMRI